MAELNIIPFGKYKDQPVDVLKSDKQYLDWLMTQDWFKDRYPQLNTVIINNFKEPSDTPEHNALVANFLDDDFAYKLLSSYVDVAKLPSESESLNSLGSKFKLSSYYDTEIKNIFKRDFILNDINITFDLKKNFESKNGNDIEFTFFKTFKFKLVFNMPVDDQYIIGRIKYDKEFNKSEYFIVFKRDEIGCNFDENNNIISMNWVNLSYTNHIRINVECKPIIGDDFPSIMRQCRSQGTNCLVTHAYKGAGATLEQVKKMFPDIKIFLVNEIESVQLAEPLKK
jgi:hypothetical protein